MEKRKQTIKFSRNSKRSSSVHCSQPIRKNNLRQVLPNFSQDELHELEDQNLKTIMFFGILMMKLETKYIQCQFDIFKI